MGKPSRQRQRRRAPHRRRTRCARANAVGVGFSAPGTPCSKHRPAFLPAAVTHQAPRARANAMSLFHPAWRHRRWSRRPNPPNAPDNANISTSIPHCRLRGIASAGTGLIPTQRVAAGPLAAAVRNPKNRAILAKLGTWNASAMCRSTHQRPPRRIATPTACGSMIATHRHGPCTPAIAPPNALASNRPHPLSMTPIASS